MWLRHVEAKKYFVLSSSFRELQTPSLLGDPQTFNPIYKRNWLSHYFNLNFLLYKESKKWYRWTVCRAEIRDANVEESRHAEPRLGSRGRGGVNWQTGINLCALCVKWIAGGNILYGAVSSDLLYCSDLEKRDVGCRDSGGGDICIHGWFTLLAHYYKATIYP